MRAAVSIALLEDETRTPLDFPQIRARSELVRHVIRGDERNHFARRQIP